MRRPDEEDLAPERFELDEKSPYRFELDRREFIAAAGLIITASGSVACGGKAEAAQGKTRLHISPSGEITVFTGKVEVGQGSRTQLTQAIAEEMRVPMDAITLRMADTDVSPDDGSTAGSRTTPRTVPVVREAAARARELLTRTAAEKWATPAADIAVVDGAAVSGERRFTYAELAGVELTDSEQADPALTPIKDWKTLGQSATKLDSRAIVTGEHRYSSDIVRPGMLYGKVLRPPRYGARLTGVADGEGVIRDRDFVGCVASTSREAQQTLDRIAATAEWQFESHPSSDELHDHLKQTAVRSGAGRQGPQVFSKGSTDAGFGAAKKTIEATYRVPYIQHGPMEPRAAVAEWADGRLTVWTGTQRPYGVRQQLSEAFRIPEDKVRLIVPDTGGGFGGKHTGECAIEAARLAKAAGKPVSLRWTREEEFTWAYFRPAGLFEMRAALDSAGRILAWELATYNAGTAGLRSPYAVENTLEQYFPCKSPMRQGSYRGIAAGTNTFAREAFMDELANEADKDPRQFRLANLTDPRLEAVLISACDAFGWDDWRPSKGLGRGLAVGTEKGGYVATCAEVEIGATGPTVRRLVETFECGAIQNPDNLRAQVEGSVIQGLNVALREGARFKEGELASGLFSKYPMPRFRDVPPIEVVLLDRKDIPSAGGGETPIITVAPAIANAIYDATGEVRRSLPLA